MLVYIVTLSVLTGLGYILTEKNKSTRNTVFYFMTVFLTLVILTSFRYGIGFDYFSYQSIYQTLKDIRLQELLSLYPREPLFFFICWCFALAGCSFQVFLLFLNSFLIASVLWFIRRYSKLPWISIYLFITLQFLAYDMNLLRQAAAAIFFLFAYPFLKNRRFLPYLILLVIGGLFHNSLLLFIPCYGLLRKKSTPSYLITLSAAAVLGYFLFDPVFTAVFKFLPGNYGAYQESIFWRSNSFEYVLPSAIYCLLVFSFGKKLPSAAAETALFRNSALFTFLISLFITKHFILERFSIYPFFLSLIAIPEIISSQPNTGKKRKQVLFVFLLFGGAYFLFAAMKGFHNVYPYVSLLQKSCSRPN